MKKDGEKKVKREKFTRKNTENYENDKKLKKERKN